VCQLGISEHHHIGCLGARGLLYGLTGCPGLVRGWPFFSGLALGAGLAFGFFAYVARAHLESGTRWCVGSGFAAVQYVLTAVLHLRPFCNWLHLLLPVPVVGSRVNCSARRLAALVRASSQQRAVLAQGRWCSFGVALL